MQKRTSLMVARDILVVATGGSTKTPLVYRCNLNFALIKTWLSRLIAKGLIELVPGTPTRTWSTTPKGQRFVLAMDAVISLWDGGPPPGGIELECHYMGRTQT